VEDLNKEGFEELEEQDLAFGQWLRASPLPKFMDEVEKKDSSSNICSRELFNVLSSESRCDAKGKEKSVEIKVMQNSGINKPQNKTTEPNEVAKSKFVDVESVAKSLGVVALSSEHGQQQGNNVAGGVQRKKWIRRKNTKSTKGAGGGSHRPKRKKKTKWQTRLTFRLFFKRSIWSFHEPFYTCGISFKLN
jgi:hypothetical protein